MSTTIVSASGLKISQENLDRLAAVVVPRDTDERRAAYRDGNFPRAAAVRDLDKRYRWDLTAGHSALICEIYEQDDVDDTHIDSALRRLVPAL